MCGIVGFLSSCHNEFELDSFVIERMADELYSRGPDSHGLWIDAKARVAFGHRRLSIQDLSRFGHQPMISSSGRFIITFNGEIYNHKELRTRLERSTSNVFWLGNSDTETLLACIELWGVKGAIEKCVGMFSFAVWDKSTQVLTLCRDRLGEKPLYYGWQGKGSSSVFMFGSDLKALKKHPLFSAKINRSALASLMSYNYIPAPCSIYEGIYKLKPGTLLTVSMRCPEPIIETYWSVAEVALHGDQHPIQSSPNDVISQLDEILKIAVSQQMIADVPVGAFLSGGIDSSTIVSIMQSISSRPVQTFSIGFEEKEYNEAPYAKAIAQHLGTEHTELYVTSQQALDVIPKLSKLFSEPFSDSSQIPTFLVSELAKESVKVSLSGDGGDELFAGYNRYFTTNKSWRYLSHLTNTERLIAKKCIGYMSPDNWNKILSPLRPFLPKSLRFSNMGDKLYKGASILSAKNIDEIYFRLITHWDPQELIVDFDKLHCVPCNFEDFSVNLDGIQKMMLLDTISYLPDDILVKIDRAGMGVSLEGRVPFLDHRVVEFAWQIPLSMKLRDGVGKWVLRKVLDKYVPRRLLDRPKMGFGLPLDSWLRGPLKEWAEDLLNEKRINREGFFYPKPIRRKWEEHLSGQRNWQYHLWDVLIFQSWLDNEGSC